MKRDRHLLGLRLQMFEACGGGVCETSVNISVRLSAQDVEAQSVVPGYKQAANHSPQTLMRKSRPREAGMCSVSRPRADGVYGKRTGNTCFVSSRS